MVVVRAGREVTSSSFVLFFIVFQNSFISSYKSGKFNLKKKKVSHTPFYYNVDIIIYIF